MDYTSMIRRNMAAMIDVSANDSGAEFKRRSYERVLHALQDCSTPIRSLADVFNVVRCGSSIGRKIAYIIDHNDDLPEVKAFFEASHEEEDHDEYENTESECASESGDDDAAETESEEDEDTDSVGSNEEDEDTESESGDDDAAETESVGSNEVESETEVDLVVPSQLQALRAVNKIEYSMLAEEGALSVTEALAHLQTLRTYVMNDHLRR
jgi:hypothetical protein